MEKWAVAFQYATRCVIKLVYRFMHQALLNPNVHMVALEKDKIKGTVRTDFILSAEITLITLNLGQRL
jgi:predicted DNA repair protein MutK